MTIITGPALVHSCFLYWAESAAITLNCCVLQSGKFYIFCLLLTGVKEEQELTIATDENQDEEPTKAKKRK